MEIPKSLRRHTSSQKFIPEIDSLRFIAVLSVVLVHINAFIKLKTTDDYVDKKHYYSFVSYFIENMGTSGVEIFFVISGFILSLPFANHYLNNSSKPSLKRFYLKRLTRLEPPYFIIMLVLFMAYIFIKHKFSFDQLFPHLVASLTYSHNVIYGRSMLPVINSVAWSLEVEIQFYLLAPLIAKVFVFRKSFRRFSLVTVILAFIAMHNVFTAPFISIYDFIQYFLMGVLLADLYASGESIFGYLHTKTVAIAGFLCICFIWSFPEEHSNFFFRTLWGFILPSLIFLLFYLVLFAGLWKKALNNKYIITIGGMCYSIYLLQNPVISMLQNIFFKNKITNYYIIDYMIQAISMLILILLVSTLFFVLIERPFMKSNWSISLTKKTKGSAASIKYRTLIK
ncbi:acyltransferase family protein [Pontibacter silvestris]|uniref:Acyltransferase family protein n=1 Tax=Pontibacter silvestris TaxID=2305183 RepID=A0ABW4X2X2_9BACT|nr:acyltransferase [Pontibacter silvestris]